MALNKDIVRENEVRQARKELFLYKEKLIIEKNNLFKNNQKTTKLKTNIFHYNQKIKQIKNFISKNAKYKCL